MIKESLTCKECGQTFKSERSLHAHLKKHNLTVAEYYTQFYPRLNLLTGKPLPFKNKEEYFNKDFSSRGQMIKWLSEEKDSQKVKKYIIDKLRYRIECKEMKKAPCALDLELSDLPPLDFYRQAFGSYGRVCAALDVPPTHPDPIVKNFFEEHKDCDDMKIFIDTREQKPLRFKRSEGLKLDFGDYTTGGDMYSYTYIDRKSEADFKSTLSVGFERFKKELERAREFNSFLYVMVESSIDKIKKNNVFAPHKVNMPYIFHNTKLLSREYSDVCQFLFSGGRKASEYLIPRLLKFGKTLWTCDMQYYIDKKIEEKESR
jgi:hypothetical protein